jgi:hypothetical protein
MAVTHLSVACLELWETALKLSRGYLFASRRSSRNVFSATNYQLALSAGQKLGEIAHKDIRNA